MAAPDQKQKTTCQPIRSSLEGLEDDDMLSPDHEDDYHDYHGDDVDEYDDHSDVDGDNTE